MRKSPFIRRLGGWLLLLSMALTLLPGTAAAVNADGEEAVQTEKALSGVPVCLVHYYASAYSAQIGCLEDGTKLTVLGEQGDFYRVDCYDMTGYVAKNQVRAEDGEYYVNCDESSGEAKRLPALSAQDVLTMKSQVRSLSTSFLGVPYVSGGTTPRGFDCCGFTQYVFAQLGIPLCRVQTEQMHDGVVIAKEDLQCGDLVFFQGTAGWGAISSHVGIYIGNGQLIHAGDGGIAIADLGDRYFTYHYLCARRVILSAPAPTDVPMDIGQNMNSSYWRESSQTPDGQGASFLPEGAKKLRGRLTAYGGYRPFDLKLLMAICADLT